MFIFSQICKQQQDQRRCYFGPLFLLLQQTCLKDVANEMMY